ncbi:uncharacterized protein LOC143355168 [Halictus rubicundus]|uniref:uncharacterized protein LOC143355168 n=1 Tax=Halictus rubicundus TaxID=77578 RepID=UPI0040351B81
MPTKLNNKYFSHGLSSSLPQYLDYKENKFNHSNSDNISQDSAICMDDNLYDGTNLPDESYMSEFSIARADSGIDMSSLKYNIMQTNGLIVSGQTNFPVMPMTLDMPSAFSFSLAKNEKKIEDNMSDVSSNNTGHENVEDESRSYYFKSSTLCKKRITPRVNKHYFETEAQMLKSCKSPQYSQSSIFLNRKIISPRRYIKWRKVKSCIAIHKLDSPEKCKFKKVYSQPNLLKRFDAELNESLLHTPHTPMTKKKSFLSTCRLSSSMLSKLSHINLPMFKQYVLVSPSKKTPETHPRQKYTPLPSPLPVPAKVAKLSSTQCGLKSPFTSCGKYSIHSSKTCDSKDDYEKHEKPEDKQLFSVLLFSFFNGIRSCGETIKRRIWKGNMGHDKTNVETKYLLMNVFVVRRFTYPLG